MNVDELKKQLAEDENVVVLDVREADEISADPGIPHSQHLPMVRVFVEAAQGTLSKDQKIITVCRSGGRCEIVARELREKGYDIDHLEGGLAAWKQDQVRDT